MGKVLAAIPALNGSISTINFSIKLLIYCLMVLNVKTFGLKCVCNPDECDIIRPEDCPGKGYIVWDPCNSSPPRLGSILLEKFHCLIQKSLKEVRLGKTEICIRGTTPPGPMLHELFAGHDPVLEIVRLIVLASFPSSSTRFTLCTVLCFVMLVHFSPPHTVPDSRMGRLLLSLPSTSILLDLTQWVSI
uniref:Uncharacterized protein n=1 Tax=Anopheles culicifacies TaxID=139723 RepID=A0A182M5E1_9DIPT